MTAAQDFGPWAGQAAALERLPDADIQAALRALPKESQILIYLVDIKGLAYKNIAEITGMSAEVIALWLYQIRCRLGELAVDAAGRGATGSAELDSALSANRGRRSEPGFRLDASTITGW